MREQQRELNRSIRKLEREQKGFQRTEQKLIKDIKKAAEKNEMKVAKIMAKDLVRIRKHQSKFTGLVSQLRAISLQMTTMNSTRQLTDSMRAASRSMAVMNRQMNIPEMQRLMQEFAKQSEMMEMKQEMVEDAVEGVMDSEEDEEETEKVVGEILDEILMTNQEKMATVPTNTLQEPEAVVNDDDAALTARLNNLKR
jgi:charged multivesicular body protein 2A